MKTLSQDIISELHYSQNNGTVVGLRLKNTDELIVSAVLSVKDQTDITLESTSVYGNVLSRTHFSLDEIAGIVRFKAHYNDPEFVRLRQIKHAIVVLREAYTAKKVTPGRAA